MANVTIESLDAGRRVKVQAGDTITLALDENPSTGFLWDVVVADAAIARVEASRFEPPKSTSPPMVGVPGRRLITVRTLKPGLTQLTAQARRGWEPASSVAATKVFEVEVTP